MTVRLSDDTSMTGRSPMPRMLPFADERGRADVRHERRIDVAAALPESIERAVAAALAAGQALASEASNSASFSRIHAVN